LTADEPVMSPKLLSEVAEVLHDLGLSDVFPRPRPSSSSPTSRRKLCWLPIRLIPPRVCRDPDDDFLTASADSAAADVLVTGDDDLLTIEARTMATEVLAPPELIDRFS
jgi:predicted nucleic acid-binding protein